MKLKQFFEKKKNEEEQQIEIIKNSEFFDSKWYLEQNPDVKKRKMSAARHYLKNGWKENRDPSAKFSTSKYLKKYPECKICPLVFEHNRNSFIDLAICAIMKNEGPYVKEWIDYHRLVGVKRFYIYDNESTDDLYQVLLPYINQGIVVYKYQEGYIQQIPAYNECLKNYKDKMQWLAFIDADEFIVPKEKNNIPEFLKDFEKFPGVGINRIDFDSNGHKKKPEGGVLENYTRVQYDDQFISNHHIKSIVQPLKVEKITNPHYARYIDDALAVDTSKREIRGVKWHPVARAFTDVVKVKKICINHYYCKSLKEAQIKVIKGTPMDPKGFMKPMRPEQLHFNDYKYDYSVHRYISLFKTDIAKKEKFRYNILKLLNLFIQIKHLFYKTKITDYINEKWYFAQYPEAKKSGLTALEHYMSVGWQEGKNPNPNFSTVNYIKKYNYKGQPLLHYVANIKTRDKNINKLIFPVTVITPIYNRKSYLENMITTLKAQTLDGIKFIIIDDGSTDGSSTIIEQMIKGDNRFYFIKNKKNQGPSAARNKAFKFVDSEYIGFFDADDKIPADYFEKLYYAAIKNNDDIVFTNYNNNTHLIRDIKTEADKYKALKNGAIWDKLYSTDLIKNNHIKFAEKLLTADNLFNIEAFSKAEKIELIDEPRYSYSLQEDSVGKNENMVQKRKKDILIILEKIVQYVKKCKFDTQTYSSLRDFLYRSYNCYSEDKDFQDKVTAILNKLTKITTNTLPKLIKKYSKEECDLVANSGYFDKKYYLFHNIHLLFTRQKMVEHYLKEGWLEGKNPSAAFDGNKYLKTYNDVARANMNPLIHYLKHGQAEGRNIQSVTSTLEKIHYALEYPIRVKEEYDRLTAEIKALESMK